MLIPDALARPRSKADRRGENTYIRHLILVGVLENVPENVDGGLGLNGNAGEQALVVDELDQLLWVGFGVRHARGAVGGRRVDGRFVVEAVKVAAGRLELAHPSFGLGRCLLAWPAPFVLGCGLGARAPGVEEAWVTRFSAHPPGAWWSTMAQCHHTDANGTLSCLLASRRRQNGASCPYLSNHHVAVKGAATMGLLGRLNVPPDLGYDGGTKGDVWHKVSIHNVDVKPVGALRDGVGACLTKGSEVGGEDARGYYRGRRHGGGRGLEDSVAGWLGEEGRGCLRGCEK